MTQRASFSSDLQPLRQTLLSLLPALEAGPDWYGSIYFERKSSKSFSANFKQTQVSDNVTMGVVFRIYNGFTLFEQATDDLEPEALKKFVSDFADRVGKEKIPA